MTYKLNGWYNQPEDTGTGTVLAPATSTNNVSTDIGGGDVLGNILSQLADIKKQQQAQMEQQPTFTGDLANIAKGVGSLASAWLGFKNLGLARDSYNLSKNLAKTNLANQANLTNQQLENRYAVMSNLDPTRTQAKYGSLGDYMTPRAVKGTL